MSRIAKELREHHVALGFSDSEETWLTAAADEIDRLREALRNVIAYADLPQGEQSLEWWTLMTNHVRAALGEGK